ncbi:MAG: N-acetylmuramoyl-L-alanine amidase [Oscillospiraceae bacterium]|nr:N-acetylmuramoyl-L-alanine amidase [Oscillospiraceae bacterium]
MTFIKTLISLILICSLAFTMTGITGPLLATEITDILLCEDSTVCDDTMCECKKDDSLDTEDSEKEPESDTNGLIKNNPLGAGFAGINQLSIGLGGDDDDPSANSKSITAAPSVTYDAIDNFIIRLYAFTLGRGPDAEGHSYWKNMVLGGFTGGNLAYNFLFSQEFMNQNHSNSTFIDLLYLTMMGRHPDAEGKAFWLNHLNSGLPRHSVFGGFEFSPEFIGLCRAAGIAQAGSTVGIPQTGSSLVGKVIFLDAGHGTIGSPGAAGYNEAVAMLDLARRIKPLLEAQGATVVMTRNSETNISIATRCAMINIRSLEAVRSVTTDAAKISEINNLITVMNGIIANPNVQGNAIMNLNPFNANRTITPELRKVFEYQNHPVVRNNFLSISLHSNATGNGDTAPRGAEVYFTSTSVANTAHYFSGYTYSSESRRFADILLNQINNTGIPRRASGLRAANYAMIREINIPAVLAENGFHTNASDRALLMSSAYLDSLAVAYRNAIINYFS